MGPEDLALVDELCRELPDELLTEIHESQTAAQINSVLKVVVAAVVSEKKEADTKVGGVSVLRELVRYKFSRLQFQETEAAEVIEVIDVESEDAKREARKRRLEENRQEYQTRVRNEEIKPGRRVPRRIPTFVFDCRWTERNRGSDPIVDMQKACKGCTTWKDRTSCVRLLIRSRRRRGKNV